MEHKKRVFWIDNMKAIGIMLVIIGHNNSKLINYIYAFHMPLFFFISGVLFGEKKTKNFKEYFIHKFKTIMIPYISFSIVLFFNWVFIRKNYRNGYSLKRNIFGIFYAIGEHEFMNWGLQMWFLPCLFVTSIIFYLIRKENKKKTIKIMILLSIIGYSIGIFIEHINGIYPIIRLPWSIDTALMAVMFFGVGYYMKEKLLSRKEIGKSYLIKLIVSIIIFIGLVNINGRVDMNTLIYKNYLLFLSAAFVGIAIVYFISNLLPESKIAAYLSVNTLFLLAFHMEALRYIKLIVLQKLIIPTYMEEFMARPIIAVVIAPIVQVIMVIPIIIFTSYVKKLIKSFRIKEKIS